MWSSIRRFVVVSRGGRTSVSFVGEGEVLARSVAYSLSETR